MGFLLPQTQGSTADTPVVWRGLMVQKAVQQLLFDVDWRGGDDGPELDLLVKSIHFFTQLFFNDGYRNREVEELGLFSVILVIEPLT